MDKFHVGNLDLSKQYIPYPEAAETQRITEIGEVRAALKQSRELAHFAASIVTQFCGHEPTSGCAGEQKEAGEPYGALPMLSFEAQQSMSEMARAMSALRRLERALP